MKNRLLFHQNFSVHCREHRCIYDVGPRPEERIYEQMKGIDPDSEDLSSQVSTALDEAMSPFMQLGVDGFSKRYIALLSDQGSELSQLPDTVKGALRPALEDHPKLKVPRHED